MKIDVVKVTYFFFLRNNETDLVTIGLRLTIDFDPEALTFLSPNFFIFELGNNATCYTCLSWAVKNKFDYTI